MRDSDSHTRTSSQGPWNRILDMVPETTTALASGASWSGHERNHLFFGGLPDNQFERLGGVSGLDDPGDSRTFATLDYDRDGWLDVVLGNVSNPRTRLLRNQIGQRQSASENGFVALRFVGGNTEPAATEGWSPRDGLGCHVTFDLGRGKQLYKEHRIDDGYKAQNSATMLLGIGDVSHVQSITVRWPSGRSQIARHVASGSLLTVFENPAASPSGEPFLREPYRRSVVAASDVGDWKHRFLPKEPSRNRLSLRTSKESKLTLYVGMATWCKACVAEIPKLRLLREAIDAEDLAMVGVSIEQGDTPSKLANWVEHYQPPYDIAQLDDAERERFATVVRSELWQDDRLPLTIVTDAEGHVLLSRWGAPTISQLRALAWQNEETP